jgi:tetratricopeptide (TPR) repeat protein
LVHLGGAESRRGDLREAQAFFEESIAQDDEAGNRRRTVWAWSGLGEIALGQGDIPAARMWFQQCLAVARETGNKQGIAQALGDLGYLAMWHGDPAESRSFLTESLAICRDLGDRWGMLWRLDQLGRLLCRQGDYAAARPLLEESLAIFREWGKETSFRPSYINLGDAALAEQDVDAARAHYREALKMGRETEQRGILMPRVLARLAGLSQAERAARLYGASQALARRAESPARGDWAAMVAGPQEEFDGDAFTRKVASVRSILGEEAFAAAWAEGSSLNQSRAVAYALAGDADASDAE